MFLPMYFLVYKCRWKIAIKTNRVINKGNPGNQSENQSGYAKSNDVPSKDEDISSLMDEARTMWKVGSYHENIVNLQGISVNVEEGSIRRVRK